jgi:hypothetical protein
MAPAVVDFIGAVDVHRHFRHVVQVEHFDAMAAQAGCGGFRRRHGALDLVLDLGQFVDEEVGGGAGAHADDLVFHHIGNGGTGYGLFQFVLGHDIIRREGKSNGAILPPRFSPNCAERKSNVRARSTLHKLAANAREYARINTQPSPPG